MDHRTRYKDDSFVHVPPTTLKSLIAAVNEIRQRESLSVPAFAERLGISYAELAAINRGTRRPGPKTLAALIQTFPELTINVLAYLNDGGRPRRHAAEAAVDSDGAGALTSRPPRRS